MQRLLGVCRPSPGDVNEPAQVAFLHLLVEMYCSEQMKEELEENEPRITKIGAFGVGIRVQCLVT